MRSIFFGLLLLIAFSLASSAFARNYYLDPAKGDDGNDGSIKRPWKTINKVCSAAFLPGDTVYVRGGTFTRDQWSNNPKNQYAFGWWHETNPRGEPGKPITIRNYPREKPVFDGNYMSWFLIFRNAKEEPIPFSLYVIVKNLTFTNFADGVLSADAGASYMMWENCFFDHTYDTTTGTVTTGHASHIIIKDCRFNNIGDPTRGFNHTGDHPIYVAEGSSHILADGNTLNGACGFGLHGWGHGSPDTTSDWISRRNTLINVHDPGFVAGGTSYDRIYVYNNTFYSTHAPYPLEDNNDSRSALRPFMSDSNTNFRIINNIGYAPYSEAAFQAEGLSNLSSLDLDYNLWVNLNDPGHTYHWGEAYYSLRDFQSAIGKFDRHSLSTDPLFVNSAAFDLSLKSNSPCIDAGRALTTTTNSGKKATLLAVKDAGYFFDGWGLTKGDTIVVGPQKAKATITNVDYKKNQITIKSPLSWAIGDSVSLPYKGAAPDMGANEHK